MLPRHGVTYSVFLLTYAATVAPRRSLQEWTQAARLHGSFLSEATDLRTPAEQLLDCGLAKLGSWVEVAPQLSSMIDQDSSSALRDIAQLLLLASPPSWLTFAVSEAGVAREYIPASDLISLRWLEPHLDDMLMLAQAEQSSPNVSIIREQIGRVGELFVLAGLRHGGATATHVSLFSDSFGYDIEVSRPDRLRLEVKSAGPQTVGQFHLTRNEFAASKRYGREWLLVQIVFSSAAFVTQELNAMHVESIKTIESYTLETFIPVDTPYFSWETSARLTVPAELWTPAGIELDPDFKVQWHVVSLGPMLAVRLNVLRSGISTPDGLAGYLAWPLSNPSCLASSHSNAAVDEVNCPRRLIWALAGARGELCLRL